MTIAHPPAQHSLFLCLRPCLPALDGPHGLAGRPVPRGCAGGCGGLARYWQAVRGRGGAAHEHLVAHHPDVHSSVLQAGKRRAGTPASHWWALSTEPAIVLAALRCVALLRCVAEQALAVWRRRTLSGHLAPASAEDAVAACAMALQPYFPALLSTAEVRGCCISAASAVGRRSAVCPQCAARACPRAHP